MRPRHDPRAEVLLGVRHGAGSGTRATAGGDADVQRRSACRGRPDAAARPGRAAPGVGHVRRPRRLHPADRVVGSIGRARPARSLLRDGARDRRPVRRDDRQVHRRRGDGGVGHAGRARGRRCEKRPRRARAGRRSGVTRRPGGSPRPPRPRGHRHRPGRDAEPRPGRRRRRPRQHGGAHPGSRGSRDGVRRRRHSAGDLAGDRLRGRGPPRAQGQVRAASAVARGRAARDRTGRRSGRPSGAVRRP